MRKKDIDPLFVLIGFVMFFTGLLFVGCCSAQGYNELICNPKISGIPLSPLIIIIIIWLLMYIYFTYAK